METLSYDLISVHQRRYSLAKIWKLDGPESSAKKATKHATIVFLVITTFVWNMVLWCALTAFVRGLKSLNSFIFILYIVIFKVMNFFFFSSSTFLF